MVYVCILFLVYLFICVVIYVCILFLVCGGVILGDISGGPGDGSSS